jgi:superfamily I DNA/RNA helicase
MADPLPKLYCHDCRSRKMQHLRLEFAKFEVETSAMDKTPNDLSSELRHASAELKRLEKRLRSEPDPDPVTLHEFRQAVDNARLTAWSVSELINSQQRKKGGDSVLAFLAAERLRRVEEMVRHVCGDIERQAINFRTNGMESLLDSVETLRARLKKCFSDGEYKVKDAAS